MYEEERNFIAEAYKIAESKTLLIPEKNHVVELVKENIELRKKIADAMSLLDDYERLKLIEEQEQHDLELIARDFEAEHKVRV